MTKVGMHGCGSGSALHVSVLVDSMGGVAPHHAAIDEAQAELRLEYNVREERRRELEFLEKGGNPLDFKFGNATSLSFHSTSFIGHHTKHLVNGEAKGSFALTASPHGDSVESIGRPGAVCEPNTADNFDDDDRLLDGERKWKQGSWRNTVASSELSSQMDGAQNAKESDDSAIFRPYARRNRSRPNCDGARSSSNDVLQGSEAQGLSSLQGASRDVKGLLLETTHNQNQSNQSLSVLKLPASNGDLASQIKATGIQSNVKQDSKQSGQVVLPKGNIAGEQSDLVYEKSDKHIQTLELDAYKKCIQLEFNGGDCVEEKEKLVLAGRESPPPLGRAKNEIGFTELNGFNEQKEDDNEARNDSVPIGTKGFDSESSCTQGIGVNNESDLCIDRIPDDAIGVVRKQTFEREELQDIVDLEMVNEKNDGKNVDISAATAIDHNPLSQNHSGYCYTVKVEEISDMQNGTACMPTIKQNEQIHSLPSVDSQSFGVDPTHNGESICPGQLCGTMDNPVKEVHDFIADEGKWPAAYDSEVEVCPDTCLKEVDRAHENSILEEARIIEAKRKRIAELSVTTVAGDSHSKSQWDFVLEEMSWLANDFIQERLWKITVAAQLSKQLAFNHKLRHEEQNQIKKLKRVAHTLAKAIMQFWGSAEVLLEKKQGFECSDGRDLSKNILGEPDKETLTDLELQNSGKASASPIQEYAVRILRCDCSGVRLPQAEAPATPDRITDLGITEVSWDDHLTEESVFYVVPLSAMQSYRRLIESHLVQYVKTASGMLEEVDTSMHDTATELVYQGTPYNEEEGESNVYHMHGFVEGNESAKPEQRKQQSFMRSYSARSHEQGSEMHFGHCNIESPRNVSLGKRPASNYGVGPVPPKHSRTTSKQKVVGPFNPEVAGTSQAPRKTDASSGDTSSFQDDHSTLRSGSQIQKSVEIESVTDFGKQLVYDGTDTYTKPRKKKKAKHLDFANEHGWQQDCAGPNEQKNSTKKRLDGHHFDSNGTSGLYGQHAAKKPKLIKQHPDNNFDVTSPVAGSIPSPATYQMSNMANTNKIMRIFNGHAKGRKAKSLKISSGQVGSGIPWSTFEDQALVVLVHDMGPNWELVGDAINSTLQFKCIFREAKECKERHRILMDKGASDGADAAEDSGSSQSYPSTLPGIPKGSARQLFQRLQGPIEEDTLKSHFEKIIMIGKRQHFRMSQIDHVDAKQLVPPHNSHVIALSQVCPNNLNGMILTPLDLCDIDTSNPDVSSLGIQGSHGNGLAIPNQGSPMHPTSVANSSLQGSLGVVHGNNCPSPSGPVNAVGSRYNAPRTCLPVEEQQRIEHYNQMLCGRSLQQPNLGVSEPLSGADRGIRMLPSGNGMGGKSGINRSTPVPRPGLQGMPSSPMLSSGIVMSSGMVGLQSPANLHSGSGSGQGNSMMRSRDGLHIVQPVHNTDHLRQMMVPEHQMQPTQGNSQGAPPFNGLSSAFANQTIPLSGQMYPVHQHHQMSLHQSHALGNPYHSHLQGPSHVPALHQQAYKVHLAKERQMQQQLLLQQQQQQQFAASGALMPQVQAQSRLPVLTGSSSMQIGNQIPPQSSPESTSLSPSAPSSPVTSVSLQQQQQKNTLPHQGLSQNTQSGASGLANWVGKNRQQQSQQQQLTPSGRHHPQQGQYSQSMRNSKVLRGVEKGNVAVHQNLIDHHHMNDLSLHPGNEGSEKGEQITHMMRSQGMYSATGMGAVQMSKPLASSSSNHSRPLHKDHSTSPPNSSKQAHKMPSHSDNNTQSPVLTVTSNHAPSATHQAVSSSIMASNHQHLQSQPYKMNFSQSQPSMQRMIQPNFQMDPDMPNKFYTDQDHDDQLIDNFSQIRNSTAVIAQASADSSNATSVVTPPTTQQWKPSETILDSVIPNPASHVGAIGSPTLSYPAGSDTVISVNHSLGQRQITGAIPPHGHNAVSNPSRLLVHPQEQQLQDGEQQSPRKQLVLQEQSQQQPQHTQSVQGSLYTRPNTSRLE